jgi:hypothetical protein
MIAPDVMLVFGGCLSGKLTGGPCPSSDSWIYTGLGSRWRRVESTCMSPRLHSAMGSLVSDGYRHSAVLFGGLETDHTVLHTDGERDSQVAVYDSINHEWLRKHVQGLYFPEKRHGHAMSTGVLNGDYGVFMFGGHGKTRSVSTTFTLSLTNHTNCRFSVDSDSNLADLWFLKANTSSAFSAPTVHTCSRSFTTVHLHVVLMFVGWFVCLNAGVFLARYGRAHYTWWLRAHAALQVSVCLLQV